MDISGAVDYIIQLFYKYIQPHLGTIAKITLIVIIVLIILRIILPIIWENILVGIIKISDKKTKNEKEDE
ncbi:MAG: hypothetical protein J6K92_01925 [Oscillospiraceae bacterium]|nr:hypothetical protein [Oscillospiraceae bacterium]